MQNAVRMQRKGAIDVHLSQQEYEKGMALLKQSRVAFHKQMQPSGVARASTSRRKRKAVTLDPSEMGLMSPTTGAHTAKNPTASKRGKATKPKKLKKSKVLPKKSPLKERGRKCVYKRPAHVKLSSGKKYNLHEAGDDSSIPPPRAKMADWEKRVTQGQWDRLPTDCPRCRGQGGATHDWSRGCKRSQKIRITVLKPYYRNQIKQETHARKAKANAEGKKETRRTRRLHHITIERTPNQKSRNKQET